MPKVVREDIDNLTTTITVTLEKSDYEPQFKAELNKYRKQGQMKGFRKGKTPLSVIKKMYGKGILSDVINGSLQNALYEYLTEEKLPVLGQPIPSEDQEPVSFDLKDMDDFVFKFDLGLAPEFEVQGLDGTFEKLTVEIEDEMVEEDLLAARKRAGERTQPEDEILENDIVKFFGKEKGLEESGVETEFSILVSNTQEAAKKEILKLKKGDKVTLNLSELEPDKDEDYVRKYLMNLDDDDNLEVNPEFECEVVEVNRVEPAALGQEFYDKAFGEGEVSSEDEAREKIKEQISSFYDAQAEALMSRDIQEALIEANDVELPEDFLKRWMLASNENLTRKQIEKEYGRFSKNLQWSLVRNKLVERFEISVEEAEIMDKFRQQIRGYFGGQAMPGMEQIVDSTAMRMMEDEKQREQVYNEVLTDKLFKALADEVEVKEKPVSRETFEEEVQKARAASAANATVEEEE